MPDHSEHLRMYCLQGDGQRYKMILRPDAAWDGVAYCHSFDTKAGEWQTIHIPFREFFPVFRARRVQVRGMHCTSCTSLNVRYGSGSGPYLLQTL